MARKSYETPRQDCDAAPEGCPAARIPGKLEGDDVPSRRNHSMIHFITHRDHRVMRKVNRWQPPRWIRLWMVCATRGGDGWLWYAMGLIILAFGGAERFFAVGCAGLAAGAGVLAFLKLKRITGRRRPCAIEPSCWARLLPPDQFSF